ncbi:hypothetical protein OAK47_01140 [Planctomycetaceae bacterium]|jgi:hypothetical protein|nr:hypothetical protein [Planctomycetaceae bacterium]MDG2389823.1 hypothetical protein [Planctomycetaceae bacterium]
MSSLPYRPLHPELENVLDKLRLKIQSYLFFHGLALVLVTLCIGFFATISLDWLYFQVSRLELPVVVRVLMAVGMVAAITWVLANQVFLRLLKSKKAQSLAMILERRFPELNDRLITAVEMNSESSAHHTPLSQAMLDHTIEDVSHSASQLELSDVFDWKPLIRGWAIAVVLVFGVGTVAAAMPQTFARWSRAFVYFDSIYWMRQTSLDVVVLAEPGDRERPFIDGVYKHPRGSDLKLLVSVPEGTNPLGLEWAVPEDVEIEYLFETTSGGDVKSLARRGERKFQFKMNSVLDGFKFWVSGNDYINRTPYRVEIVSPPQPDSIALHCHYPAYMGLNLSEGDDAPLDERQLQGKQIRIPAETAFLLTLKSNKPLTSVIVQAGPYEFTLGQFATSPNETGESNNTEKTKKSTASNVRDVHEDGSYGSRQAISSSLAKAVMDSSNQTVRLPFVLSSKTIEEIAGREFGLPEEFGKPWVIPADSEFKIYLEDQDGIISAEPERFSVLSVEDAPPQIETELAGIGSSITKKARIPVKGLVTDDFGILKTYFDFKIDDAEKYRLRPFKTPPRRRDGKVALEHRLAESEIISFERFNVEPLELDPGQKLILTVYAMDNDNLNGPHENRGRTYNFTIVTEQELLAILNDREINLRRQFEQIISELERTRDDLLVHRDQAAELVKLRETADSDPDKKDKLHVSVTNAAERSRHQIGKNRTETTAVAESFQRILDELKNNRVHSTEQIEKIESLIITPLKQITESTFEDADIAVGLFSQKNDEQENPLPAIDQTTDSLNLLLTQMRKVLEEMSDLAEFHELIQGLREMINGAENVQEKTEKKQKEDVEKLKDSLKKLGI